MRIVLVLCGATLIASCASVPAVQKVESNTNCDYALMQRIESAWQPTLNARYWVNCPQVRPASTKS
jgi:hypothetical protein